MGVSLVERVDERVYIWDNGGVAENEHVTDQNRLYTQAEVDALIAHAHTYSRGKCRGCGGAPGNHRMHCRHYEGPLDHGWTHQHYNQTFGGVDWYCTCGQRVRVGGIFDENEWPNGVPKCPAADQTRRPNP
jgi:hypothetical protein